MSRPQTIQDASAKPETSPLPASESGSRERERTDRTVQARFRKRLLSAEHEFSLLVDFAAEPGFSILFGPSGAGKTTLLDCVAGLATPDAGRIAVNNRVLFDAEARLNLPVARRQVGYVFQDLALFPHLNAEQNVAYGLAHLSRTVRQQRALAVLDALRIAHLRQRRPAEISGGERQRVALARALVTDPSVLLLDEPLAALDARTKSGILDDLRQWNQVHRIPVLYVTHSREEVFALGERVLVLDNGQIIAQGTPHEVLSAPQHETVAQLAGFENIFDASVEALHAERGTMTCCLATSGTDSMQHVKLELETPLVRAEVGTQLRVGIRAGDILVAVVPPLGLSARNIIAGRLVSLEQRDVVVRARIDCGVQMEVHLTLAARDALQLHPGRNLWLVIKTHSCHLMAN
jgi:molybdate transport system ATP-binding protein